MAETQTLTASDILLINAALLSFDQPVATISDGKEQRRPYDLSEKARYALIRNLKRLKSVVTEINEAREALQISFNPGRLTALPPEKQSAWDKAHHDLMMEKHNSLVFHTVKLSEFRLEKNPALPSSVIATLIGTVVEDDGPSDEVIG